MAHPINQDQRFLGEKDIEEYVKRYLSKSFMSEQLNGMTNGDNVKFNSSSPFSTIQVFVNGLRQDDGTDYRVIDNKTIMFLQAPSAGSKITAQYILT